MLAIRHANQYSHYINPVGHDQVNMNVCRHFRSDIQFILYMPTDDMIIINIS